MNAFKMLSVSAVAALSLMSASSFAETISVTGSTLSDAEAKVSAKANSKGATVQQHIISVMERGQEALRLMAQ